MPYLTPFQYYQNDGNSPEDANWGEYQYVSLHDIVNNFMLNYTGNHSLINNEERYKVLFHAKRAIQELNYDAFKNIKILELDIGDSLRFILPQDYVNWVRISVYKDGVLMPLTENTQTNYAKAYLQDNNANILFDQDGNILEPENSNIDTDRLKGMLKTPYLGDGMFSGLEGYYVNGSWFFDAGVGQRYGLDTSRANANPTFRIDKASGVINFNSDMMGETCILEYISDGMEGGDNTKIFVNKLFEHYVYEYINYEILNKKLGVQEYIVNRVRKKRKALWNNAKIRISNIKPGRVMMMMRGRDKWIK